MVVRRKNLKPMVGTISQKLIYFVAMIDTIGTWTKHIGTIHIGPKRIGNQTYVDKTDRRQSVSVTKHIRDKTYRRQNVLLDKTYRQKNVSAGL
jgi:hypothetical protein